MGAVVVHHQVQRPLAGELAVDAAQESQKLLLSVITPVTVWSAAKAVVPNAKRIVKISLFIRRLLFTAFDYFNRQHQLLPPAARCLVAARGSSSSRKKQAPKSKRES
jgi:hypothetical protein